MEVPKKEVIDDIYKNDKPNDSKENSEENKKNDNEDKKDNDDNDKNNDALNTSKLNESHLKRRPGVYNIYPSSKKQNLLKEEKKEDKDKEKEKEENEEKKNKSFYSINFRF